MYEAQKRWRLKNPEKVKQAFSNWKLKNKDKMKSYSYNQYLRNKDSGEHKLKRKEYAHRAYLKLKKENSPLLKIRRDKSRNKDRARELHLVKTYGITSVKYNELSNNQNNLCKICLRESKKKLFVDHDHTNGKVRGLLCYSCNSSLGLLKEDIEIIKRMIDYINFYK